MINAETAETIRSEVAEKDRESLNAVSGQIVDASMRVHTILGPGLLESAYEVWLMNYENGDYESRRNFRCPLATTECALTLDTGWIFSSRMKLLLS